MRTLPFLSKLKARWILAATAGLLPVITPVSSLAVTPLLAFSVLALLVVKERPTAPWQDISRPFWYCLAAIVLWAGLSLSWGELPLEIGVPLFLRLLATVAGGCILISACRRLKAEEGRFVLHALFLGILVGGVLTLGLGGVSAAYETFQPYSKAAKFLRPLIVHADPGVILLALLCWPALYGMRTSLPLRKIVLFLLIVGGATLFGRTMAAKLAFVVGGLVFLGMLFAPRLIGIIGAVALLLLAFLPLATARLPPGEESLRWQSLPMSSRHRLAIWEFATGKIAEHPVLGWGFGSSRVIGAGQRFDVPFPEKPRYRFTGERLPLHPHNFILQIWLELGAIGILGFMGLAALIFRAASRSVASVSSRATTAAVLSGGLLVALVSFGFWQNWWQAALWMLAGFALIRVEEAPSSKEEVT